MPSVKPALILFVIISVSVLLLSILYDITREPIRLSQIARETAAVNSLVPGTVTTTEEYVENNASVSKIVTGYDAQGVIIGYAVTASAPGYAGAVEIMAGFNAEGRLMGVQVISQRETPGLGTAILNEDFLEQFAGRTESIIVVRMPSADNEIAALASATISTVAVVEGVNAAMEYIASRIGGAQ